MRHFRPCFISILSQMIRERIFISSLSPIKILQISKHESKGSVEGKQERATKGDGEQAEKSVCSSVFPTKNPFILTSV